MRLARACHAVPWLLAAATFASACRAVNPFPPAPRPPPHAITEPVRRGARLTVSWIGHASALVQMDDKLILTDPVFTARVGLLSQRTVAPAMRPEALPPVDAVLISHMHFDHLSLGSLEAIEEKVRRAYVPEGGLVYLGDMGFDAVDLAPFASFDDGGLRVTAVPVKHNGMRYGADVQWMRAFTGYVVEYHGLKVYFGGDTGYARSEFTTTGLHFPGLDLALLPIAPLHPRAFMRASHMDPEEALQAMQDLGAAKMIPIHYDTIPNSTDAPGEALASLRVAMAPLKLEERVEVLEIGETRVLR
jgi:L-ascorbate metabolism protein UlaG (beta-lactamase superfamily)